VNEVANAVSLMFASLGTDIADPLARVEAVHSSAHGAKHLQDAIGPDTFLQWLEMPSPFVIAAAARLYVGLHLASRAPAIMNLLVSNVPGPPVTLFFGGARLLGLYPLGPVYDGVGLNITVVSSADTIGFGFVTCPDVLSDVDALAAAVPDEFTKLRRAVRTADTADPSRSPSERALRS
jgi:diacylglycerol O-acyltransferase